MSIYLFFLFDSFDCPNGIGSTYIVEESVALEMLLAKVRAQHSSEQHYTEKSRRNIGGPDPFPPRYYISVNPLSIRGDILCPSHSDFQAFLRPCSEERSGGSSVSNVICCNMRIGQTPIAR